MQWFRFYNNAVNDPKVQSLPAEIFKAWVNILCLYSSQNEIKICNVSFLLRVTEDVSKDIINQLVEHDLLTKNGDFIKPKNWEKWQYSSDNSTERVKKHRNKMKRYKAVTVTPPEQNRADTDTDTEQRKNKPDFLPDFIDVKDWKDFEQMRRVIKKPMTDRARKLIINKLTGFKERGYDIKQILENSIANNWQDVYLPKEKPKGGKVATWFPT